MKVRNNIEVTNIDGINYSGQVNVKILSGNKVISEQTYHNNGRETLFKFLCNALSGNYIERQRPCQLKLFVYPPALKAGSKPEDFDWETVFDRADTGIPTGITPFIMYDTAPVVTRKQLKDYTTYTTTYHFRIPFTMLSQTVIHMAGLYPTNTIYDKEASAYYLFTDETGSTWKPIEITDNTGNFSIVIDWILVFQNLNLSTEEAQEISKN